jgi:hypothetical protein
MAEMDVQVSVLCSQRVTPVQLAETHPAAST